MKKSINIGLILFLLLQACSSGENTDNQASVEPIPENTPINPPPPGNNPPPPGGNDIDRAIQIIKDADDDILDCISKAFPEDTYQKIVNDLNPDNFEAGVIIGCFQDPSSSNNITQPPPPSEGGSSPQPTTAPSDSQTQSNNKPSGQEGKIGNSWYDLNIYEYTPSYSTATSNGNTGFGLNESGDILLSGYGFNNSGGATKLNHPVSISANAGKLAVTDRFNNRVLIWNSIPTSNTAPDLVLGQANFSTHNSGTSLNNMNFPGQVVVTPDGKVLVADSDNNRVLVWTSFPTTSGQPASYEIYLPPYVTTGQDAWPWGVWSDGTKVIIAATVASTILLWDTFPGPNDPPNTVLTSSKIGTPRSITSNGEYIMFGDENGGSECGTRSTHIFSSWPTSSRDPDACIDNWIASAIDGTNIYGIAAGGETMYFYDQLYTTTDELKAGLTLAGPGEGHRWAGGDDGGATIVDGKLFVAEYNGNRISVFDEIPSSPTEKPDWALQADSPTDYTLLDDFIIQNPIIDSNGRMLFVSSDFDRSLSIWKELPGSTAAQPDIVMKRFDQQPWDLVVVENEVYLGGESKVFGWTNIESTINSGNFSFDLNAEKIGSIAFKEIRGIAYNGTYFAVADKSAESIYIWEGVPSTSDEPAYTLSGLINLGRIDMNDDYLAIGCYPEGPSFKLLDLNNLQSPSYQTIPGQDCPSEMSLNELGLFMQTKNDNSIIGWSSVEEALSGASYTMSFGGTKDKTNIGTRTASGIGWDGYHFWVGEFKFSNRLLGFAPSK